MIATRILQTIDELAEHKDQWNTLALHAPQQIPTLSYPWVASYLEHRLLENDKWFAVLAYEGESLLGVLPLIATPSRLAGISRPVLHGPHDLHTPGGDLVAARGREPEVIPLLLSAAAECLPRHRYIQFSYIADCSPTLRIVRDLPSGMRALHTLLSNGNFIPTNGDFAGYRAKLSANFRHNLNKASKKLHNLPEVQTVFLAGSEATAETLSRFAEVEARSWKYDAGTAILLSPALMAFYGSLCRRLSEAGWLEWQLLEAEGRTIAANLAVRFGRSIFLWKVGYDAGYARCAPGNMLLQDLIRKAHASGEIDEINLVTDMTWHNNWHVQKRPYYQVRIYPRGLLPQLHRLRDLGIRYLKTQPWARRCAGRLRGLRTGPGKA